MSEITKREHTIKILQNLSRLKTFETDIQLQLQQLEEDRENPIQGISYEEKAGPTYKVSSSTENQAVEYVDRSKMLKHKLIVIGIAIKRINNSMQAIQSLDRTIVAIKIIEDKTWEKVMEVVDFKSEKKLREKLNKSLDIIGTLINDIDIDKLLRYAAER